MNDQTSCPLAHSDAAYVLGALSPAERLEYERHLPTCASCRRSVAQLAGMPGLLGRVPVESVEEPIPTEPVPPTVLPALVSQVRREQRRRALVMTLGAAAAVAAVAIGAAAIQASRDDSRVPEATPTSASPTVAPAMPMSVVVDYGVTADVSLTEVKWGTKVGIDCHYAERPDGSGHEYRYNLVAITRNGGEQAVASWRSAPGDDYTDQIVTALKLRQIERFEVQSERGQTILKLDL